MDYKKYQHVSRINDTECNGLLAGTCYVFPKIDGTNSTVWLDNGIVKAGSRNRELELLNDNAGFYNWVINQQNIKDFLTDNPTLRLYGEWLVPHTLRTYREDTWRKFYVFDIVDDTTENYLRYENYKELLDKYGITYLPALAIITNPNREQLLNLMKSNTYLISDGLGNGEGIVVKNYDFKNKYGHVIWGKMVSNEFKDKFHQENTFKYTDTLGVEEKIIQTFCTPEFINKEYSKIELENGGWTSKYIPRLLNTVHYCMIKEEMYNAIKLLKNPTVDFKLLQQLCNQKVKNVKPELFRG